jgi:hypothetical protein
MGRKRKELFLYAIIHKILEYAPQYALLIPLLSNTSSMRNSITPQIIHRGTSALTPLSFLVPPKFILPAKQSVQRRSLYEIINNGSNLSIHLELATTGNGRR